MASRSKIEWTDATWNPILGCSIVSPGCTNCYAMRQAHRLAHIPKTRALYDGLTKVVNGKPVWTGDVRLASSAILAQPDRWQKPRRIFVDSMGDLFHKDVRFFTLNALFTVMMRNNRHTYQILTKRPERLLAYVKYRHRNDLAPIPNNIWLGISVEDQKSADQRFRFLMNIPRAIRWVSAEPLLGPITLPHFGIDWLVAGGESGPNARPMHPDWARSLRDQCLSARIPFTFKQWGEHISVDQPSAPAEVRANQLSKPWDHGAPIVAKVGKKAAGRLLDGQVWDEQPTLVSELSHG